MVVIIAANYVKSSCAIRILYFMRVYIFDLTETIRATNMKHLVYNISSIVVPKYVILKLKHDIFFLKDMYISKKKNNNNQKQKSYINNVNRAETTTTLLVCTI